MSKFNIIKEYLKSVSFSSKHTPSIFFGNDESESMLSVNIDTQVTRAHESLYEVTITIKMTPRTRTKEVFNLECEYSSIVALTDTELSDDEVKYIMMVEIPHILYPIARNFIGNLTYNSGFPPIALQHFDFEKEYKKKMNEGVLVKDNVETIDITDVREKNFVTYDSIVEGFHDSEEGEEFVKTCVSQQMNPGLPFDETPMYKYLMRFIGAPDFNTPTFDDVEIAYELYETLFRLIATDKNVQWRLEEKNNCLELIVTYKSEFQEKAISEMTFSELENLMTSLIINSWVEYNVLLSNLFPEEKQTKIDDYIEDLGIQNMPTRQEYVEIFANFANSFILNIQLVNEWFTMLEDIDIQTMQYRF